MYVCLRERKKERETLIGRIMKKKQTNKERKSKKNIIERERDIIRTTID
jgi:hypothetical protein